MAMSVNEEESLFDFEEEGPPTLAAEDAIQISEEEYALADEELFS